MDSALHNKNNPTTITDEHTKDYTIKKNQYISDTTREAIIDILNKKFQVVKNLPETPEDDVFYFILDSSSSPTEED